MISAKGQIILILVTMFLFGIHSYITGRLSKSGKGISMIVLFSITLLLASGLIIGIISA